MNEFSLRENIIISYRTYFHLFKRTFFACRKTQARLTFRRFLTMMFFSPALLALQTVHWLFYIADDLFFPGYRTVDIEQPLFVVGVPRSGTTFLHRFLSQDKERFITFSMWELIFAPTITQRRLILFFSAMDRLAGEPLGRMLKGLERLIFGSLDDIHKISLSEPEEDYFALAPIYACFLMILPFPFPEELGHLAYFDDQTPESDKARIFAFYKTCLQRHLYVWGTDKILLSKNVSFSPMIETLNRFFPECKIIGTVRDPLLAVPSHISSMMAGAAIFDNDIQGETFRDQMMEIQAYAFSRVGKFLPGLPESRQVTVKMEDLKAELYPTIRNIYDRLDYKMSPDFEFYLRCQDREQKRYQSRHNYDLTSFNLSAEVIYRKFADVYRRYGYPKAAATGSENIQGAPVAEN